MTTPDPYAEFMNELNNLTSTGTGTPPKEFTADQRQGFQAMHEAYCGMVEAGFQPVQACIIIGASLATGGGAR